MRPSFLADDFDRPERDADTAALGFGSRWRRLVRGITAQGAASLLVLACPIALSAGCGGGNGQPDRIGSVTQYDAAVEAKTILSDESIDEGSIAFGKVLFVDETIADTYEGQRSWRVTFETLDQEPSDICIWLWLSNAAAFNEEYTYVIDRCPIAGNA